MMAHWGMLGTALAMAGLGAALGGIGGLLGIGGGLLAIPVLALWFGMDQSMAQGTALVMIVPNVLLAFYRYRQHHTIPLSRALGLGGIAMLASYPAATAEAITTAVDHMHRTCSPRNQACSDRTRTRWERIAAHSELAPAHQQCWDLILAARAEDETSRAHQSAGGSNSDQRGSSHG